MTDQTPTSGTPAVAAPKTISRWLFEGVFIVLSVLLGFAVSEFGESRRERELARQMLASVQAEIDYNRGALEPFLPFHGAWSTAMDKLDPGAGTGPGIDAFFAARPPIPPGIRQNVPFLRRAAWDTASSTGALRLIDYDLAAALSEIYGLQQYASSIFSAVFAQSAFYDSAARAATIKLSQTMMTELVWIEGNLFKLYEQHLPAIRAAASGR